MFTSKLSRRLRLCAPVATLALLALPAGSHAEPSLSCHGTDVVVCKFDSGPQPSGEYPVAIPCLTAQEGIASGTGRETGGGNFDPDPDAHWGHFHSSYVETGRIDFPSGVYVLYRLDARGGAEFGDTRTTVTYTESGKIVGTVHGVDGSPTGEVVTNHVVRHFTFIDSGDAGIPFDSDPTDTFLANVDRGRWTCS
jgi:hypothetical protein